MVDLGGYVIILVETHDKKVKLYGKHNSIYHCNFVCFAMKYLSMFGIWIAMSMRQLVWIEE